MKFAERLGKRQSSVEELENRAGKTARLALQGYCLGAGPSPSVGLAEDLARHILDGTETGKETYAHLRANMKEFVSQALTIEPDNLVNVDNLQMPETLPPAKTRGR